jgi:hypothetical protein
MDKQPVTIGQVVRGALLWGALNAIVIISALALSFTVITQSNRILIHGFLFFGVVQLIWQLPAFLLLRWRGY